MHWVAPFSLKPWMSLEGIASETDAKLGKESLRRTLAEAMSAGGQGSRDGGRTRGMLLRRAAALISTELKDLEQAFTWLGDALITHVDDEGLDELEALARDCGDLTRAETVLSRALEEVFDGPLVRKLLSRRAQLRAEHLNDKQGAAADLKKLHDLSPADQAVIQQLGDLYEEIGDYKGMVQLLEDQILRGKDPTMRTDLARKVARLWEEKLMDAREAADAWRRVLRMKSGDPEATEGLDRAKSNMLKRSTSDAPSLPADSLSDDVSEQGADATDSSASKPGTPARIPPPTFGKSAAPKPPLKTEVDARQASEEEADADVTRRDTLTSSMAEGLRDDTERNFGWQSPGRGQAVGNRSGHRQPNRQSFFLA